MRNRPGKQFNVFRNMLKLRRPHSREIVRLDKSSNETTGSSANVFNMFAGMIDDPTSGEL